MRRTVIFLMMTGLAILGTIGLAGLGTTHVQSALAQAELTPTDAATAEGTADADLPPDDFFGTVINVTAASIGDGTGTLMLKIHVPDGYKFNDIAPFKLHVYNNTNVATVAPADNDLHIPNPTMPVSVPITFHTGTATLTIDTTVYYCEAVNENLCFPANLRFVVPLSVTTATADTSGPSEIGIDYTLVPPQLPSNTLGSTPAQ
jgi:hypothetical protein